MLEELVPLIYHLQDHDEQEKPSHVSSRESLRNALAYLDFGCLSWKMIVMVANDKLNTSIDNTVLSSHVGT